MDRKLIKEFNHGPVIPAHLAISPDGKFIFTAAYERIEVDDPRYKTPWENTPFQVIEAQAHPKRRKKINKNLINGPLGETS